MSTRTRAAKRSAVAVTLVFCFGAVCGLAAGKKGIDPGVYQGKTSEVGHALAERASELAEGGSWERLAVARVLYLGGDKAAGQALIDAVKGGKPETSDLARIARIFLEAGEKERGLEALEAALATKPNDPTLQTELGAYLNLAGQRERAEQMFGQAFGKSADVWDVAAAAGSYLGVPPRKL